MTQTSTVVHSINFTPQKSAGESRKTAKNLAVPLALLAALAVIGYGGAHHGAQADGRPDFGAQAHRRAHGGAYHGAQAHGGADY